MTAPRVNGYVVVSSEPVGSGYQGLDRRPWSFVSDQYYTGRLPAHLQDLYHKIREEVSDTFWTPPICGDLADAVVLADYWTKTNGGAELVAVFSPYLREHGGLGGWEEPKAVFLGADVMAVGEWSLLRELLEAGFLQLGNVGPRINRAGLLVDSEEIDLVERLYRNLAEEQQVEPIAEIDERLGLDATEVFRISPLADGASPAR